MLLPDRSSRTDEVAMRDQFGVLHDVGLVVDHPGDEDLALREPDVLPDLPLVLVAGVGGLDQGRWWWRS
jgi:hypothetical protein